MTARVLKTADDQYCEKVPFAAAAAPKVDGIGRAETSAHSPFLRIPPFPGARTDGFAAVAAAPGEDRGDLVALLRNLRVGGTYWAAQPQLPPKYVLARSHSALRHCADLPKDVPVVLWAEPLAPPPSSSIEIVIKGDCDPWHMLADAVAFVTEPADEVRAVAAILGVPTYLRDEASGQIEQQGTDAGSVLAEFVATDLAYLSPFDGHPMSVPETAELCGFWRRMIDSNREIACGIGFAFWKQDNLAPLLWSGSQPFAFLRTFPQTMQGAVAIWRSKTAPETISELERRGVRLIEVEDGFLRSKGLGADCIPPLSVTVDRLGAHFDPAQASELEVLLETASFDPELLARARQIRSLIVKAGLGKYERGRTAQRRPAGNRRHILVPGQVEDDRSVQTGGSGMPNIELLRRVREQSPEAYILFKPHPDVLAGHRSGSVAECDCLAFADQIVTEAPIAALIEMVDEVHVNTSLTGFEALMRGKPVTTYGAPFYAGWGLTHDLGAVPSRRTARRGLDELVAATLLVYPRYRDPMTGLPCPAEVVVARLADDAIDPPGLIVAMRRLQGRFMRRFRSIA
jgi:capsular polysaccharide export protein